MEIGASTSCFYPLETEKALDKGLAVWANAVSILLKK